MIIVPIPQTPNIRAIQGYMEDMLNLELKEESEEGRAQRLRLSLNENKQVLLIVDDICQKINLRDLGIVWNDHGNGTLKVIITTRDEGICASMGCQKKVKLKYLSEMESWDLFKTSAEIDENFSKSLDDVPMNISRECKGLPIAIKAVGSSLKGKIQCPMEGCI